jgi:hypothetical protein
LADPSHACDSTKSVLVSWRDILTSRPEPRQRILGSCGERKLQRANGTSELNQRLFMIDAISS